jgi:hypothetical protein
MVAPGLSNNVDTNEVTLDASWAAEQLILAAEWAEQDCLQNQVSEIDG